ncbi:RluA family pseudouridine synthase [Candidatus Bipolaricaulota bacterium]|nr:RluA family pseudouridine synthase [Candidatus Bipolaricaulota bacterium]
MIELRIEPDSRQLGRRIDQLLAEAYPELSRTEIQQEIRSGNVLVSGESIDRASYRVRAGDRIEWEIPNKPILTPQPIPLDILYEDAEMVVINKSPGIVVHPGAGTSDTTLVEGLLVDRRLPVSDDPARPGIVHRLDRETSGVIVVAKTLRTLDSLKRQFSDRATQKHYIAVVAGLYHEAEGHIDAPIGRDPAMPQRMSIQAGGRPAKTDFTVLASLRDSSLLWVRPRTGRTHQIRVHLRYTGHSILGDEKYGGRTADRLMLHAWRLVLRHPTVGEMMEFRAPIPEDFPEFDYESLD